MKYDWWFHFHLYLYEDSLHSQLRQMSCPLITAGSSYTSNSLCHTADMCRTDNQSSHSKPALSCFIFAGFTRVCWHFLKQFFLNKNVLFLDHLTTKKAPWFLEMWGNIQRHIVITQKRLEHLAHWLWEPQISQKMLSLFLVQNGMEHHLNFERLRYSEIFISKCLCC